MARRKKNRKSPDRHEHRRREAAPGPSGDTPAPPPTRLAAPLTGSPSGGPAPWRAELPWCGAVAGLLLALYAVSMPHTVTLEDSGEFLTVARFAGIAHPPGYPLYTMLAKLFTLLPVGSVATRVHLLSALCGAGAGAMIYLCGHTLTGLRLAAFFAALLAGVSSLFWSHATIAEVYALHGLLYFSILYCCLRMEGGFDRRAFILSAFLLGLSLANHYHLMVLGAGTFLILLLPHWRAALRCWLPGVAALLAGLTPYLYLPLRAAADPYISLYDLRPTLADFWWYVSRAQYADADVSRLVTWRDDLAYVGHVAGEMARGFSLPVAVVLVLGVGAAWRLAPRRVVAALLLAVLGSTVLIRIPLRAEYDFVRAELYLAYQIVPFGVAALFFAYALAYFHRRLPRRAPHPGVMVAAGVLALGLALGANAARNYRPGDTFAADYARILLEHLPPDAALFTYSDHDIWPLAYMNLVEGVRPDVTLYSQFGFLFGNRLFNSRFDEVDVRGRRMARWIEREGQAFVSFPFPPLMEEIKRAAPITFTNHGLVTFAATPGAAWAPPPGYTAAVEGFLEAHGRGGREVGPWQYHRDKVIHQFCRALLPYRPEHPIYSEHVQCRHIAAAAALNQRDSDRAAALFTALLGDMAHYPSEERYLLRHGLLQARLQKADGMTGDAAAIKAAYQAAVDEARPGLDLFPKCANKMLPSLLRVRAKVDVHMPALRSFRVCPNLSHYFSKRND